MFNNLPTWAKVVATVGFPIAVTAFLLMQSAGLIPSEVRALNQAIAMRRGVTDQHIKTTEEIGVSIKMAARIMCENAARDDTQRRNCEQIR